MEILLLPMIIGLLSFFWVSYRISWRMKWGSEEELPAALIDSTLMALVVSLSFIISIMLS